MILMLRVRIVKKARNLMSIRDAIGGPLVHLIAGVPGCRKSQLIHWLQAAMQDWSRLTDGCEFATLPFQNSTAASVQRHTIHVLDRRAIKELPRLHHVEDLATWVQYLHVDIIDELSVVPAELLKQLHVLRSRVARKTATVELFSFSR